ncbi:MFS-type transporter SLC18B1-like [Corticium candelabrum]|uniref:MFS-type transporter SLC18B1-like n=1 Tax=Corticium candelabrum TaxID=121492 RepID=UPI002E266E76|nr:MFS-type transporter SLC18B1-like [Corticium candelabrum]XP_062509726.1 MFS-type transporter SLC18B1-like [Corticium candelabrum]
MNDDGNIQKVEERTTLLASAEASTTSQVTSKRRLLLLAIICFVRLAMGMSYSLPTAFYAHETYRWKPRDEGSLYNGILTGCASPFLVVGGIFTGQVAIHHRSSKFIVCWALFMLSGSTLMFGFVSRMTEFVEFFTFSLLLRMTTGFAMGTLDLASFAIGISTFPSRTGLVAGFLELTWGAGMAIGAPFGGLLRDYGGFSLPFFALAAIQAIEFITAAMFVRSVDNDNLNENTATGNSANYPNSVLNILNFWVVLTAISGYLTLLFLGFPQGALAPFAESHLGLKPGGIGLVLLVSSGCYVIISPITGKVTEWIEARWLVVVGLVTGTGGFLLMGYGDKLAIQIAAQALLGTGSGIALPASYVVYLEQTKQMGYDICEETNSAVYVVALVAQASGEATGSAGGGPLAALFGFLDVCIAFAVLTGSFSFVYFIATIVDNIRKRRSISSVKK